MIESAAKKLGKRISKKEMFRTFNMGYGFAVIVSAQDEGVVDLLNRHCHARIIGKVASSGQPKIVLENVSHDGKTILL